MSQTYVCTRWAFDLGLWVPTLQQLAKAMSIIQAEERMRIMRFHFLDDLLSSLIGRLLMRKYVSHISGLPYSRIQFARDERGKPYWKSPAGVSEGVAAFISSQQLSFNVSHQGDLVVLAGVQSTGKSVNSQSSDFSAQSSCDFGVGVDVMKIEYSGGKSLEEFFRIMYKKFSENEWCYIKRKPHDEKEQLKAFMRHWCLKEAFVKEMGVGITIDLQRIAFTVDPNTELDATIEQPLVGTELKWNGKDMSDNWCFEEHMLQSQRQGDGNNSYCAALAFRNCKISKAESFQFLQIEELLIETTKAEQPEILECCQEALKKQRRNLSI